MRKTNANTEGQLEGTLSDGGPDEGSPLKVESSFSSSENGGSSGGELFAPLGTHFGSGDVSDSVPETERKRGRPKGSKNARKSTPTAGGLAAAKRKLTDALSGVVGFGISYYGTTRAKPYKVSNPQLAYQIYACYQIPPEAAQGVGAPLADAFCEWFPQYVEPAVKGVDPALAIWRFSALLQQCDENEKIVIARSKGQIPGASSKNGSSPEPQQQPEPSTQGSEVGDMSEWLNQHPQTPSDLSETGA